MVNVWLAIWGIIDFASANTEPPNHEIPAAICEYEGWACSDATGVAWCESLMNPRAYHPEGSHGLFQIHEPTWGRVFKGRRWEQRYDYRANLEMAIHVYEAAGGWHWWTCGRRLD
mgnify:FL=1